MVEGRKVLRSYTLMDADNDFIFAFSHRLEPCSVLDAELWVIYHGLCISMGKGFTQIIVASDSLHAIQMLNNYPRSSSGDNHLELKTGKKKNKEKIQSKRKR